MKQIKTKRNLGIKADGLERTLVPARDEEMQAPKQSHVPLYTLIITCLVFLCMVYMLSQMDVRLDKMDAKLEVVGTHLALLEAGGISTPDAVPFCYGYNAQGVKGFALDERKINTPCEGVNVTK